MKKIIALILVLMFCLGLCACGEGSTANNDYKNAMNDLTDLLNRTVQDSELQSVDTILNILDNIPEHGVQTLPPSEYLYQDELEALYNQFTSFGDYKQSKEILDRFSIVENGRMVVNQVFVDFAGNERVTENIDAFTLDDLGRKVATSFRVDGRGGECYTYDSEGNLIREINDVHFYNEQGLRTESYYFEYGSVGGITTYIYDENGNCIEETHKGADGFINMFISYRYDENGNCVEETYKASDGTTETVTHIYDEFGNPIESTSEKKSATYTNIYDNDNNLLIVLTKYSYDYDSIRFSIYNKNGNVLDKERIIDGSDITITDYQYENGLPLRVDFSNGMSYTYEYSPAYFFDAEGLVFPEN